MIKKRIIFTAAISAACLFAGCTDKNIETPDNAVEEDPAVQAAGNSGSESFENLTETAAQGVCIDYVIESYENVQEFGYDLFAQSMNEKNPVLSPVSAYLALSMAG